MQARLWYRLDTHAALQSTIKMAARFYTNAHLSHHLNHIPHLLTSYPGLRLAWLFPRLRPYYIANHFPHSDLNETYTQSLTLKCLTRKQIKITNPMHTELTEIPQPISTYQPNPLDN